MRSPEFPRARMPTLLHVEILRQGREPCCTAQLPRTLEDYLRAVIITLQLSTNFKVLSCKLPHVAHIFQVVGKDDRRKRTEPVIFAKIEIVDSISSSLYPNYLSGYALSFTDVLLSLIKSNAGGRGKLRDGEQQRGG